MNLNIYNWRYAQTITGVLRSNYELLIDALSNNQAVTFIYDEKPRVVEVHAIGISTKGELVMRGYQVDGQASRPLPQWTLFTVNKIEDLLPTTRESAAPREGYAQGDKQMHPVIAELSV